ncbi:uncharacterized protein ALTATR162_LOCUS140 [Alternaria atra]|uniref:Uncharacterized protein n=1 Tax=Alternaria atra TaxID=119953 RepID=A0A8J2HQX6_9PLEO|nr:uncharacterized protein ALTATR162_LOCUS140 [Alternaria atra]CAG5137538.1 unnamed protein product [Alternaria atra]
MGPEMTPASVPFCYTPDPEALPPLMQSPPASVVGTPLSSPLSLCSSRHSPSGSDAGMSTQDDHEIAFLLRRFSEGPSYWMDLFDLGTYFASYVPVQARESSLLRYAAVACAAKSLARVQGRKLAMGGSVTRQAQMEQCPEASLVDWKHRATIYYDKAVSLLLHALQMDVASSSDESECELRYSKTASDGPAPKRRRTSSDTSFVSNTDELLAVLAILCIYGFLDTSVSDWVKHLAGAKSLLIVSQEHAIPLQRSTPTSSVPSESFSFTSKAQRATFWNIARQDMLAAFINKTNTRLDTEDLSLWREAGVKIDDQGYIMPSNTTTCGSSGDNDMVMRDDLICNAIVWLMAKLVNFMAACDEVFPRAGMIWAGVPQQTLLYRWFSLRKQFQVWHDGLPVTFKPSARVPSQASGPMSANDNASIFTKVFFSVPMCASTMQTYHMSQILLFINKPHESTQGRSTVVARMNSYQSILDACQKHSREIVGISLARSDEAVRIHSVQPLFTAGQCLRDARERQVVLHLLRDIESDIGWATDYRVCQLLEQW